MWILGNVVDNPRAQGDQLFAIAAPFSGAEQEGSGLGGVRTDDDLHIAGNLIAGRGRPAGVDDCTAPDRGAIASRNELDAAPGLFRAPGRGDFVWPEGEARQPRRCPSPGPTPAASPRSGPKAACGAVAAARRWLATTPRRCASFREPATEQRGMNP